jgi:hypothetical protein
MQKSGLVVRIFYTDVFVISRTKFLLYSISIL